MVNTSSAYIQGNQSDDPTKTLSSDWSFEKDGYFDGSKYATRQAALDAARKAGRGVFRYNGKLYNTIKNKSEAAHFREHYQDYDYFLGHLNTGANETERLESLGGWKPSLKNRADIQHVEPEVITPQQITPQQTASAVPTQETPLTMFSNRDIRSLGFNNFQGMLSAVQNPVNQNNAFVKAMQARYGTDYSLWSQKQADIEKELGVKGKYRSFGGGDFGDMSRSMASWMGTYNAGVDKRNLANRTGNDGIVYSNAGVKNLFDKYPTTNATPASVSPASTTYNFNSTLINPFNNQSISKTRDYTDKYQLAKPQLVDLKFKKGGMLVNKYQQGGVTSDPMDQLAQVAAKFLQGDTQSGQQLAQVFSDQKVGKQLMQAVQQGVQQKDKRAIIIAQAIQALSGSRKARLGAKLNYFHKDICPAGEKLVYFKKGGEICKACQKMEEGGTADPIADFKKKKVASKKPIQKQDLATRDSIAANRYNDQEVQVFRPGSYKKNAKGQVQWTPDRTKAPYNKVTKHQQGGSFKEAFDSAYGKQRYFTWNGKVYAAYKGDKRTDKGFQKAVDNLQEQANALKDYGAGQHLGWNPGANTTAIKHNSSGNMQGVLNDVVVTAKRVSPKQKADNQRKQYFDQWTAYVKKWHPNMIGRFKNTMQNMGYTYNWNTGTYDKNGKAVYRLNNGQLQTANIYTGNWSNISNSDALPRNAC